MFALEIMVEVLTESMVGGTAKQKATNLPLKGDSSTGASQCFRRASSVANKPMLTHRQGYFALTGPSLLSRSTLGVVKDRKCGEAWATRLIFWFPEMRS